MNNNYTIPGEQRFVLKHPQHLIDFIRNESLRATERSDHRSAHLFNQTLLVLKTFVAMQEHVEREGAVAALLLQPREAASFNDPA
jgi:hypothetical protein